MLALNIYVVTAAVPDLGRTHEDVAAAAIAGGADVIQFRDKRMTDEQFETTARALLTLCHTKHVPLIINDRVDVAIKIGADGVHVGQNDMPVAELRRRVSPGMIVGVSARTYQEAVALADSGADYLGVGPIFPTPSKDDASTPIGIVELGRICKNLVIPVVAIGGITAQNLPQIIDAGAAGAAVISAVTHQPDMRLATAALRSAWRESRQKA